MIISASRRSDIPSFYGKWFLNRLKEGYVLVPNPYNSKRYSKVNLTKEAVDIIVFWTKNPKPFFEYLKEIDKMGYEYYFQFTITPYDKTIEKNLPSKEELMDTFIYLSNKIGRNKVIWRYDPVIIDEKYTLEYHEKTFNYMAKKLRGYTSRCIISFVDGYESVVRNMGKNPTNTLSRENMYKVAEIFSTTAKENDIELFTCSEEIDLEKYNIRKSACIDKDLIEEILGVRIDVKRDKNQRKECMCIESIEVGAYNSCGNGCSYCYAIKSEESASFNIKNHDVNSPTLIGEVDKEAAITNREEKSVIVRQMSLFEERK